MTVNLLINIVSLTIFFYVIGAFIENSFNTKYWNADNKAILLFFYIAILFIIIMNHIK